MTEEQKIAYLQEHLPYEVLMLRYAIDKITTGEITTPQQQLDWNAHYESFVLHARNLYMFLTNGDRSNVKASNFVPEFKAQKTNDTISTFQRLGTEAFHLGPERSTDHKVAMNEAKAVKDWLLSNFSTFVGKLNDSYRVHWQPTRADPATQASAMTFGPTGPSATNHIFAIQTENFTK
jgi:hypothetical protein